MTAVLYAAGVLAFALGVALSIGLHELIGYRSAKSWVQTTNEVESPAKHDRR